MDLDMARKETITKKDIQDAAFDLVCEEGVKNLTARKLALKIGCSTQPIFRVYQNMEELTLEIFEKAKKYFADFYNAYPKLETLPFLDLGLSYISFAQKEPFLFQALFLTKERYDNTLYDLLNGSNMTVVKEINKAKELGVKDPGALFMKMWIFIHGSACMVITGDYDLNKEQTKQLLFETYYGFIGK